MDDIRSSTSGTRLPSASRIQALGKQCQYAGAGTEVRPKVFLDLQYLLHESKGDAFWCVWEVRHFPAFYLLTRQQTTCIAYSYACLTKLSATIFRILNRSRKPLARHIFVIQEPPLLSRLLSRSLINSELDTPASSRRPVSHVFDPPREAETAAGCSA